MLGIITTYALYLMVSVAALSATASILTALAIRRGAQVSNYLWQSMLSLIAGIAPYVGLFGTVWHIIAALSGIGGGNLNVSEIARPIGEALTSTLWGLGAALIALSAFRVANLVEDLPAPAAQEPLSEQGE